VAETLGPIAGCLLLSCCLGALGPGRAVAQAPFTLTTVGGDTLPSMSYGDGSRGVVIVSHGGYSTNRAWAAEAQHIAAAGYHVIVFETRGAVRLRSGQETDCLYDAGCMAADVMVAVRYLRQAGARTIAVLGASAGGGAASQASVDAPGEIDRLILLAPMEIAHPERMTGEKLFITARNDRNASGLRLPGIRAQYRRAPEPKRFLVLEGAAHGQQMFAAPEGEALRRSVLRFLSSP